MKYNVEGQSPPTMVVVRRYQKRGLLVFYEINWDIFRHDFHQNKYLATTYMALKIPLPIAIDRSDIIM